MLQELLDFLQANNLNNFLVSIIISFIGIIIAFVRTRKTAIQKRAGYVNLNNFKINDYVIIYGNLLLSFKDVKIVKKTDLTKVQIANLIDKGGVLNETTKNE